MNTTNLKSGSAMAAAGAATGASAGESGKIKDLIGYIKGDDDKKRGQAWQNAHMIGVPAIKPLADVMTDKDFNVARAAKRAIWKIVRDAGRPGADGARKAAVAVLLGLCGDDRPVVVRREVIWMLSEIGGDESVDAIAKMLTNKELREDARCGLQRIPGGKSLAALKAGLAAAPADFKPNIAQALRKRGVDVPGIPCVKLKGTKPTKVKPVGR